MARELHRTGVHGEHAPLLQPGGEDRAEQKGDHRPVTVPGALHHDLPPLANQAAGHPVHRQHEEAGRGTETKPMRIHATLNERTVPRTFRERKIGRHGLTVIDNDLPAFAQKVSEHGTRTYVAHVARRLRRDTIVLGKVDEVTVTETREKAVNAIKGPRVERETCPLVRRLRRGLVFRANLAKNRPSICGESHGPAPNPWRLPA